MENLSDKLFIILEENLSISEIWEAVAPRSVNIEEGVLTFTRLPSIGTESITRTSIATYQFSVRHKDLKVAQDLRDEIVEKLNGFTQRVAPDNSIVQFFHQSDLGDVSEADSNLWVCSSLFNLKYIRR